MKDLVRTHPVLLGCLGLLLAIGLALDASAAGAHADSSGRWQWPLSPVPDVVARFDPPSSDYGAGHRGVDLLGRPGQTVAAVADGTVTFAGRVAGKPVVVVDHGSERSTYEPVTALVSRGDPVRAGEPIGVLTSVGSHCLPSTCLHLGRLAGDTYLDPLELLGTLTIRLKPLDGLPADPPPTLLWTPTAGAGVNAGLALG